MNIAIVGSRTFHDYEKVKQEFFNLPELNKSRKPAKITIVSGGAYGADELGQRLANDFNYETIIHYPEWDKYGKKAGFLRNQLIVRDADIVMAFWKDSSKGTKHTIDIAKSQNKPTYIYFV